MVVYIAWKAEHRACLRCTYLAATSDNDVSKRRLDQGGLESGGDRMVFCVRLKPVAIFRTRQLRRLQEVKATSRARGVRLAAMLDLDIGGVIGSS